MVSPAAPAYGPPGRAVGGWLAGGGGACRGGREIALQPLQLRRRGADVDLRIERHHVPGAQVVAVVALPRRAGGAPEIAEIGGSSGGVVVMDPGRGAGARLLAAPC